MTAPTEVSPPPSGARRLLVTICMLGACLMQALDQTIANIALPFMQGGLSASLDQINWVLTSYIIAAAIMTAPAAWLATRFGTKRLFVTGKKWPHLYQVKFVKK